MMLLCRSLLNDVQLRVSNLGQGSVGSDEGGSEVLRHLGELQRYMSAVHGDVKSLISPKETVCFFFRGFQL